MIRLNIAKKPNEFMSICQPYGLIIGKGTVKRIEAVDFRGKAVLNGTSLPAFNSCLLYNKVITRLAIE